mmetsp:Transcript_61582/g.194884  ORF Transcript_61582/g.194884 Transcript_61582/m.194884 type:complete len:144 (+) Transcript_61582:201-632(+)
MDVPASQRPGGAPFTRIVDLRPNLKPVNVTFIVLEKGTPQHGGGTSVGVVADSTGSVNFQFWGAEADAIQPGDIIRLLGGMFASYKGNMILKAGKMGVIERIGESNMVFCEVPNMSRIQWLEDKGGWAPAEQLPSRFWAPPKV